MPYVKQLSEKGIGWCETGERGIRRPRLGAPREIGGALKFIILRKIYLVTGINIQTGTVPSDPSTLWSNCTSLAQGLKNQNKKWKVFSKHIVVGVSVVFLFRNYSESVVWVKWVNCVGVLENCYFQQKIENPGR